MADQTVLDRPKTVPHNAFAMAQAQFDNVAEILGLDTATRQLLRQPIREYQFSIPVRMDDGTVRVFRGFRVRHNDARGPGKGGIRFHPQETIDTVRALAMWMTWCARVDIWLGGSKGGVVCDPHNLSAREQEQICRGWVRQIARDVGPLVDVPAPDVMTTAQHMLWMLDEYEMIHGGHYPGFITGKPVGMGGLLGPLRGDRIRRRVHGARGAEGAPAEAGGHDGERAGLRERGAARRAPLPAARRDGGLRLLVGPGRPGLLHLPQGQRRGSDELLAVTDRFGGIDKIKAKARGYEVLPGTTGWCRTWTS